MADTMSNFEERLAASEARLAAALDKGIAAASAAVTGVGATCCLDCSAPISAARRSAAPFAQRCIVCQTKHERGRAA